MSPVIEKDGKLHFEFNKKGTQLDLKNTEDALRTLVQLVVTLDLRLQVLESKG